MPVVAQNGLRQRDIVRRALATCILTLLLISCSADERQLPAPPPTTVPAVLLNVGISDHAGALAPLWATGYGAESDNAAVNFVSGSNATLFEDLETGRLDAILVHHIPENAAGGQDQWFNPVALDGLVIVAHPQNTVASLTLAQVQGLFSGQLASWSAVGGAEWDVQPFEQERSDGAHAIFTRRVMGATPISINTIVQSDSPSLLEAVASEPSAVGYTMLSALQTGVQAFAIDGVAPTPDTVTAQEYPLTVPLYFVATAEPQGALRAFLAWLQSTEGQTIVSEKVGTVR